MIRAINSDKAPAAIGPYSQGVKGGKIMFVSGQIPMKDGVLKTEIKEATKACIENGVAIIREAGLSIEQVMKTTVYLTDINDFDAMNEAYVQYFVFHKPARSVVQVAALPKGAKIEIEFIVASEESFDL